MKIATEFQRRRKDNRLIVGLVLAVLVIWAAVSVVEQRAAELEPSTITRGLLLFVLSYINVTLIAAVLFVLGRTLIKLWLDRRHPALGSRFQTKLLVTYIGLTAIPVALVFYYATGLLQHSIDRWFSTPVRQVVQQARAVQDRAERRVLEDALGQARALAVLPSAAGDDAGALEAFRRERRLDTVEAYRAGARVGVSANDPEPPALSAETLGGDGAEGEPFKIEVLPDGSHRYRAAFRSADRVYAAGIRIPASEAQALDSIAAAWSEYKKLEVQKPAIKAANISTFLLITLAILFASIWTGLDARAADHRSRSPRSPTSTRRLQSGRPLRPRGRPGHRRARRARRLLQPDGGGPARRRATRSCTPTRSCRPPTGASTSSGGSSRRFSNRSRPASSRSTPTAGSPSATRRPGSCSISRRRSRSTRSPPGRTWSLWCRCSRRPAPAPRRPSPRELAALRRGGRAAPRGVRPAALPGRRERARRLGARDRGHDARRARAEARGLERGRAPGRARDQEPADADPAVGRTDRPPVPRRRPDLRRGDRARHEGHRGGGRFPEVARGRVFAVRAAAGDAPEPTDLAGARALGGPALRRRPRGGRRAGRVEPPPRDGRARPGPDEAGADQPDRQRPRGLRRLRRDHRAPLGTGTAAARSRSPTRAAACRSATGTNSSSRTSRRRGAAPGLGLAIVSRIVADHNGTIRVEDNRPRGARFIIELPAA